MTMEKTSERRTFREGILASWGIVSTLLLLVIVIGGAIYINDLRSRCDDDEADEVKTKHMKDDDGSEDIYMSNRDRTILYIKKNTEGAIMLISDVNYYTKISATYITKTDSCYLAAGEELDWYAAWNDTAQPDDKDDTAKHEFKDDDSVAGGLVPDRKNKVTDMSILPRYIRPYCEGKPVYWMVQPDGESDQAAVGDEGRAKRSSFPWCWYRRQTCPYTGVMEDKGRICYHFFYDYRNGKLYIKYMSLHCKNWDLISMTPWG